MKILYLSPFPTDYNFFNPVETFFGILSFKHANILEVPTLRTLISNIIKKTDVSLDYISAVVPRDTGNHPRPRLHFTPHSPLTFGFTDSLGNYSGSTATGTAFNIPSVTYERYGEVQWLSIPKDLAGQLVMRGTSSSSFTLDAEEVNGNITLSTTSFEGVPSSTSTIVTMNILPTESVTGSSTLVIDQDGNGTPDMTLQAKQDSVVMLPITKLPLTVIPTNKTITLGSLMPVFTVVLSGFVGADTATSTTSGAASCTTTATATSMVGIYPITCSIGTLASSKYDFTTFATGTLTILYKWSGFLQPINDTTYNLTQTLSVFKGGSVVPVKFQLKTASGTVIQASTLPLWLNPQNGSAMSATVDESAYADSGTSGTTFKWDSTNQQYVYNWSTKGLATGYWYKIFAKLDDDTVQSVVVGIR